MIRTRKLAALAAAFVGSAPKVLTPPDINSFLTSAAYVDDLRLWNLRADGKWVALHLESARPEIGELGDDRGVDVHAHGSNRSGQEVAGGDGVEHGRKHDARTRFATPGTHRILRLDNIGDNVG